MEKDQKETKRWKKYELRWNNDETYKKGNGSKMVKEKRSQGWEIH
jgi:hypothetical protein